MPGERQADPEILQALEEAQQALRHEQAALGSLPKEHVELGVRLARLEQEREELRRELEALRQGRPSHFTRLPQVLTPPFDILPRAYTPHWVLQELAALVVAYCLLLLPQRGQPLLYMGLVLLGALVLSSIAVTSSHRSTKFHFGEEAFMLTGEGTPNYAVSYARVLSAEASATPSQRKRGVGDVRVKVELTPWGKGKPTLLLKNVPEPERLARWLRERCGQKD